MIGDIIINFANDLKAELIMFIGFSGIVAIDL